MSQCSECVFRGIATLLSHKETVSESLLLELLELHCVIHKDDLNCALNEFFREEKL